MNEEQRQTAILNRLKEMGVQVDQPLFTLTWKDVARIMVQTDGFEEAAGLPTDMLVHTLNTVQEGLEYLNWYENIQHSLHLAQVESPESLRTSTEDEHLESNFEDRVFGPDN